MHDQASEAAAGEPTAQPQLAARMRDRLAQRYQPIGDEPVDDLGIPLRVVQRVLTAIFAVIGANILLLSFTPLGATLANPALRAVAAAAMIVSPLWIIVGKRAPASSSRTMRHVAAILGTFIFCFSAQYTGELRGALMATMLISPIIAAIAMPRREAIPYLLIGAAAILVVGLTSHEYGSALRAVVLMIVTLAAGAMVIATRGHLVFALDANRDLSETDPLTGAGNVRSLFTRLADECERASRLGSEFACAQFDLDEFKLVNDRHSHSVGDAVLVAVSNAIGSQLTEADLLVRRGGDEFVVVVPAAADRDVAGLVEACAGEIRNARRAITADITPTASAGWVVHRRGESPEQLLSRVDAELHESKLLAHREAERQGRRRGAADAETSHSSPKTADNVHAAPLDPKLFTFKHVPRDPTAAAMAVAWKLAAVISVTAAIAVLALIAVGAPGVAGNPPILAITVGAMFLAPICWRMSQKPDTSPLITHIVAIVALAVITIGGFFAGPSSAPGADLYLLTVFIFVFVVSLRASLAYGAFVLAMYTYFLISADYPEIFVRVATTTVVVVLISAVIGLSRIATVAAANRHRELSQVDALTELPNLRQLRARLGSEIRRCQVTGETFALVMLDLDDFKQVNDRHGHTAGDAVLIAVADALRVTARAAEMPARRGGDEFAVVLAGAGEAEGRAAAERIGRKIAATRKLVCPDITPTAGVGFAQWQSGESVDQILHRADDALHDAKRARLSEHALESAASETLVSPR